MTDSEVDQLVCVQTSLKQWSGHRRSGETDSFNIKSMQEKAVAFTLNRKTIQFILYCDKILPDMRPLYVCLQVSENISVP